jgi:hypothetical protein
MTPLTGWENFYVIVGSSAGALIGLQFVVITLIADLPPAKDVERAVDAFASPTIVHFGSVLLLSALVSIPWRTEAPAAIVWGGLGLLGVAYTLLVLRRIRIQEAYSPVFEDQLFHFLLPLAAYLMLTASALAAFSRGGWTPFGLAASALLLLLVGIHNAWDAVTYNVLIQRQRKQDAESPR